MRWLLGACCSKDAAGPLRITLEHEAAGEVGPYSYASVIFGPVGLGQELGRILFGSGAPKAGGGTEPSGPAGAAGILLVLGGVAVILFAIYMFATRGGASLFK